MLLNFKHLNTDICVYEQEENEKPRLLQHERLAPLSLIRDDDGKVPHAIINCSYFTPQFAIGRNQGDLRNDTYNDKYNGQYCDLVFTKDGQYHVGKFNSWDYVENVVAGMSLASHLIKEGKDVEETSPFGEGKLLTRRPQTAIGILANGKILLIVSEGDGNGDRGLSGYELRSFIRKTYPTIKFLGQCDGGGSSEMLVNGKLANRLSEGRERSMWNGFALISDDTIETPESPVEKPDEGVIQNLVDKSNYKNKCPYEMTPTRLVIHNTANDASARNEVAYMIRNTNPVSFHFAVDDKEIVQGIPLNRNSWNAGDGANGKGNREGISIEICYSKSGGDRFIQAEKNTAKFVAKLLKRYGWGIDKVTKHQDYSGKYCPHRTLDMGWDRFINMIEVEMKEPESDCQKLITTLTNQLTDANKKIDKLEIDNLKLENENSRLNGVLDEVKIYANKIVALLK